VYFDFSKEQYMARDSAREFLARHVSTSRLRQVIATDTGFDRSAWRGLADLGWTSVLVPEDAGGLGLGFLDLALLLEESGRALLPGPLVETAVMLPLALAAGTPAQRRRWLPGVAQGEILATAALTGSEGLPLPAGIPLRARADGPDWILDGAAAWAPFGALADVVVAAARTGPGDGGDGVSLFLLEAGDRGLTWQPVGSLDPTTRLSALRLESVRVPADRVIGAPGRGWPALERALQAGATALALQAVGGAGRALEMAVAYAKVRHQFGKPIGSFQAIKHTCADMLVAYETSRAAAYYAAWAVGAAAPDAAVAAAIAKSACTEMFRHVSGEAIQVHGGIGFTWEHDLHFYFKRAKYLEFALGRPAEHRELVARSVLSGRS
jgi:alkylation response protein AidB-like acyl-CoA dehydrogenase